MKHVKLMRLIRIHNWDQGSFLSAWDDQVLKRAKAFTVNPLVRRIPGYAEKSTLYFHDYSAKRALTNAPVGCLNAKNHMFHYPSVQWGFQLTEPQITKSLAWFLNRSPEACWLFVKSLLSLSTAKTEQDGMPDSEKTDFLDSVSITAEEPVYLQTTIKRIDLVVHWTFTNGEPAQQHRWVAIECKFKHHITHGQLPAYSKFIKEKPGRGCCVLIAQHRDYKSMKKLNNHHNRHWLYIEWLPLLRRWEHSLTTSHQLADVEGFSRFRRTLWQRATGN